MLPGPTMAASVLQLQLHRRFGGDGRALGERGELGPDHGRVHLRGERGPGGEPAVGAGDDVLPADQARVLADAVGDELGMLDVVGRVPEQPGQQDLPVVQRHVGPDPPLVLVPRVGHLEGVGARVDPQHDRHHVGQRDVVQPRAVVEPVAGVQPDPVLRDAAQRVVERVHVLLRPAAAVGRVAAAVVGQDLDQPRVVHLQQEARLDDGQVLLPHGLGHRGQVVLLGGVVVVAAEAAGTGRRQERLDRGLRG